MRRSVHVSPWSPSENFSARTAVISSCRVHAHLLQIASIQIVLLTSFWALSTVTLDCLGLKYGPVQEIHKCGRSWYKSKASLSPLLDALAGIITGILYENSHTSFSALVNQQPTTSWINFNLRSAHDPPLPQLAWCSELFQKSLPNQYNLLSFFHCLLSFFNCLLSLNCLLLLNQVFFFFRRTNKNEHAPV